jgi:N-terminal domain of galactosyltransferase
LSKHEASYILTYRQGDDPARRENLFAVLAWLANYPQFDVIVVEQDSAPHLQGPLPHPSVRHLFLYNPGPFNKSWGFNAGFRLSDRSWFAFGDADVIVGDVLPGALTHLRSGYQVVKPYRRLIDLDADESRRVIAGEFDWLPARAADAQGRESVGEHVVFAGGLFLIARPTFVRVGGWDERFRGWGGEDDAMSYRLERLRVSGIELDRRPALHLHHARPSSQTMGQPHYASNRALLADYPRLTDAELLRFSEVQMQIIGHREKYRPQ